MSLSEASAPRALHRFAVATALATYLLIVVGGLVRGAPVATWIVEVGHRAAAMLVGLLTLGLAVGLTYTRPRSTALPKLGWIAVGLVMLQGVLGAAGAALRLPSPVAAIHTGASLVCFLTLFYLAAQTTGGATTRAVVSPSARRLALVSAIAVLLQALLGALVRTGGAALACPDYPLCGGTLWPQAQIAAQLQVLHRLGAVTVAVLAFASAIHTYRAAASSRWLRALALAVPLLVAAQISLGVRSVQTLLDAATVQAHLAVGAALLAASWAVYLLSAPAIAAPARPLLEQLRALVELAKPRITTMVVVTFAGGLWLAPAPGGQTWRHGLALLGTVLIVAAANALNMYLERDIDGRMERTRRRPLVEGRLSPELAVGFGAVLACLAIPLLLIGSNPLTAALGLLAFVSYVWAYTPLKRVSGAALFVGAVPGAMPPLMGWTTATGVLDAPGLALFAILFIWQLPHFLAIALYRADDYASAGFRVLPLSIGVVATRWQIALYTAALVLVSLLPVQFEVAGRWYLGAALILGAWFLARSLVGFRAAAPRPWARSVFLVSLLYLTGLFAALAIDHALG